MAVVRFYFKTNKKHKRDSLPLECGTGCSELDSETILRASPEAFGQTLGFIDKLYKGFLLFNRTR